ncbi:MAG: UPF0280 family protein [Hyphomicrobiales bacterium]|nr:UPF0280 family protein [Hyphomicrobiales bacterium]
MSRQPTIQKLAGERLHLSHGPIDVVLKAWGSADDVRKAHRAIMRGFPHVLPNLTEELKELRKPIDRKPKVKGSITARMVRATEPFADEFITPMAAVAGAVAEALLELMLKAAPDLERAYVNDGGDIALHLTPGQTLTLGVAGDFTGGRVPALNGSVVITNDMPVRGVATSGAQGRSFSLGIADSVTVLAASAGAADAAATLIANAVNVDSKVIERAPASELDPDSDLGDRLVTTEVGRLPPEERAAALAAGRARAESYLARGLICGALLSLQGETCAIGGDALALEGRAA